MSSVGRQCGKVLSAVAGAGTGAASVPASVVPRTSCPPARPRFPYISRREFCGFEEMIKMQIQKPHDANHLWLKLRSNRRHQKDYRRKVKFVAFGIIFFPGIYIKERKGDQVAEQSSCAKRLSPWSGGAEAAEEEETEPVDPEEELRQQLAEADEMFNESRYEEAFDALQRIGRDDDAAVLWRQARVLYNLSRAASVQPSRGVAAWWPLSAWERARARGEQARLLGDALELAQRALQADERSAPAHKWRAVLLQAAAALDTRRYVGRARQMADVRRHLQRAVDLDPRDPTALYMLGQWCLTGAQLPWAQRLLLALLLGEEEAQEAFACSLDEAALLLERAEAAKPRFYSRNLLTLGRVHLKRGREDLAGYYLQEAAQYPAQSDDDHAVRREASALLSRLQRAQAETTPLPGCRAKSEDPKDTPPSQEPAAQPRGACPSSNHEEDEPCVGSPKEEDE